MVGRKTRRRRSRRSRTKKVGKRGSKSNPYPSKAAAMRGKRKGTRHFKRKGRTIKMKAKNLK